MMSNIDGFYNKWGSPQNFQTQVRKGAFPAIIITRSKKKNSSLGRNCKDQSGEEPHSKVCGDGIKMGSFGTGTAVRRTHSKVKIGTGGFNATSRLPLRAGCAQNVLLF